jgi:hypothetical protein
MKNILVSHASSAGHNNETARTASFDDIEAHLPAGICNLATSLADYGKNMSVEEVKWRVRARERCASRRMILTVDADDFSHVVDYVLSRVLELLGRDHSKNGCLCKVVKVV